MNPTISWPGGKRRLVKHILPKLPEHRGFIEVFGGGAAVLLAKEPSPIEVYNDLDERLVTFFRVARNHPDALLAELELIPNARSEFEAFLGQEGLTDIQRAARWFVRNKTSFGAKGQHFGTSRKSGGAAHGSRRYRLRQIQALNERLDSVCIERLDWRELLPKYDHPENCFYFDPPYTAGYQYPVGAWDEDDHLALREAIMELEGPWVLSYDDSDFVRELYSDCRIQGVDRQTGINHAAKGRFHEVIITP